VLRYGAGPIRNHQRRGEEREEAENIRRAEKNDEYLFSARVFPSSLLLSFFFRVLYVSVVKAKLVSDIVSEAGIRKRRNVSAFSGVVRFAHLYD